MSTTKEKKRKYSCLAALVIMVAFVGLIAAGLFLKNRRADTEPWLREGRAKLQATSRKLPREDRLQLVHEAKQLLEQCVNAGDDRPSPQLLLAVAMAVEADVDSGGSSTVQRRVNEMLEIISPADCPIDDLLLAAQLFAEIGYLGQADWVVGHALQRTEKRAAVLKLACNVRLALGKEENVVELCQELKDLTPDDSFALETIAYIHENQGSPEVMIEDFRNVIDAFPDKSAAYRIKLVERLILVGDRTAAKQQFEILEQQAPGLLAQQPIVRARMLHVEGEADEASEILREILATTPKNAAALLLLGRIQLANNEIDDAIKNLIEMLKLQPTDTQGHYLLAQAYARKGKQELADAHFAAHRLVLDTRVELFSLERKASADPNNPELPEKIALLYDKIDAPEHAQYWRNIAHQIRQASR